MSDLQCQRCGDSLPVAGSVSGLCPECLAIAAFGPPPEPPPEIQLGSYALLEELGAGGMGRVFRARQSGLNRYVALKMIIGGAFANAALVRRLRTEAEAAAALRHPHIVAIHEVDEAEDIVFFSMELLEGGSLAERVARGPLPVREAV